DPEADRLVRRVDPDAAVREGDVERVLRPPEAGEREAERIADRDVVPVERPERDDLRERGVARAPDVRAEQVVHRDPDDEAGARGDDVARLVPELHRRRIAAE